jgi:hypothetical protein
VTPERARGLQLYALAAIVLVGGGVWFFRAAPYTGDDPRVKAWRATVIRELPDVQPQIGADTVVLGRGADTEAGAPVPGGSFTLTMICAGVGQVRVRLSSTSNNDTGRPVRCADQPQPVTLTVGLGTEFYLSIAAETDAAVFRWRLTPATTN